MGRHDDLRKRMNEIAEVARQEGWNVALCSGGHFKWVPPDREHGIVFSAATPSDWRAIKNLQARLRQRGLPV